VPPKSTVTISVIPSPSQSQRAGVPEASAAIAIGKPGSIVPVAPLNAASEPSSSPITTSFTPSPLMSATTGLDTVASLVSTEKRDEADHGETGAPLRLNTYTRPLPEAATMSVKPSLFMSASAGDEPCATPDGGR